MVWFHPEKINKFNRFPQPLRNPTSQNYLSKKIGIIVIFSHECFPLTNKKWKIYGKHIGKKTHTRNIHRIQLHPLAQHIPSPRPSWGGSRQDLQQLLQRAARTAGRQSSEAWHLGVPGGPWGSLGCDRWGFRIGSLTVLRKIKMVTWIPYINDTLVIFLHIYQNYIW